jgi:hypothetical protein
MKVIHGALGLVKAETRTMVRGRRGSSIPVYASLLFFTSPLTHNGELSQAWDDGGQDAHHGYQDYGVGGGGGFHGHKKRLVASDPSPHVIFLGLDIGFTESDVRVFVHHYHSPASTLMIRSSILF